MNWFMRQFNRLILAAGIFALISASAGALWLYQYGAGRPEKKLVVHNARPDELHLNERNKILITGEGFDRDTRAALVLDAGNRHAIVGRIDTPATCQGLKIKGQLAYLANNFYGLQIIDLRDPAQPKIIGSEKDVFQAAWDLDVLDDHVLVADARAGLIILNVRDPRRPRKIGQYPGNGRKTWGVTVLSPTVAVLAQGTDGILILDISDMERPKKIAHVETNGFSWKAIANGDLIYVCDGDGGLKILDLSEPENPRSLGSMETNGHLFSLALRGGLAFLADGSKGVKIVDIRDPRLPRLLSQVENIGLVYDVAVRGNNIYATAGSRGFERIDISDLSRPRVSGLVDTPGIARAFSLKGEHAFISTGHQGLQVVKLDRMMPAQSAFDIAMQSKISSLMHKEGYLVAAEQGQGLHVFQDRGSQSPQWLESRNLSVKALDIVQHDDMFFLAAGRNGLQIFRRNGERSLDRLGGLSLQGSASRVLLLSGGRTALIAAGASGMTVVDVSDPLHPLKVKRFSDLGDVIDIAVSQGDSHLIVTLDRDGVLHLLESQKPHQLKHIGSLPLDGALSAVEMVGRSMCAVAGPGGLSLVDLDDPRNPQLISNSLSGISISRLWALGDTVALLANRKKAPDELILVDVSFPEKPRELSRVSMQFDINSGTAGPQSLYLAEGGGRLLVLDLADPELPRLHDPGISGKYWISMHCSGGKLWGANMLGGLGVLDLENHLEPREETLEMENFWTVLDIEEYAGSVWILDKNSGLHSFSPRLSTSLDTLSFPDLSHALALKGNFCYVLSYKGELRIVDITDPENLQLICTLNLGGTPKDIAVKDHFLLAVDGSRGIDVWDLSNPDHPVRMTRMATAWPRKSFAIAHDVAWKDDIALVANGKDGLLVLDMSSPLKPAVIGHFRGKYHCQKIWLEESIAFVQVPNQGLLVIDLKIPSRPMLVGTIETQADVLDLAAENGLLWLALKKGGIKALPMPVFSSDTEIKKGLMQVTFPPVFKEGLYRLQVFNKRGSVTIGNRINITR